MLFNIEVSSKDEADGRLGWEVISCQLETTGSTGNILYVRTAAKAWVEELHLVAGYPMTRSVD